MAPADWVLAIDPSKPAGALDPALLGQYDLSGALFHYDAQAQLGPLMKSAGFAEWRVGVGRWELGTQLLPALTDGTSCGALPAYTLAPAGTTDLDLIAARDWFTYTDGTPVTAAMTGDDSRYALGYVRSVLDVATAFGVQPYVDIDHTPRALAANQTPSRNTTDWPQACQATWTNRVSNAKPADPTVFASAVVGLVRRVVEGSGGQPGRPVRYWELWNEADVPYAWSPSVGDFPSFLQTAVAVLGALDAYRKQTTNADGRAIRIGLGSFSSAQVAATVLANLDAPFDFLSFHSEVHDDPAGVLQDIRTVAAARQASTTHASVELVLAEWTHSLLGGSTLDPHTMDVALHHAASIAYAAASGVTRAHHALFWDFYAQDVPDLGFVNHDFTPLPAYFAFTLAAPVVGTGGSTRLDAAGVSGGELDSGRGAVFASKDAGGAVRVLLVNRNGAPRTVRVDLPGGPARPSSVTVLADPSKPPASAPPSTVVSLPPRSLALLAF